MGLSGWQPLRECTVMKGSTTMRRLEPVSIWWQERSKLNPVRTVGKLAQFQGQRVPSLDILPSIVVKIVFLRRKLGSDWM